MVAIALHETEVEAGGTVYRALRDDVCFPYVVVGEGDEYEPVFEHGEPDGDGGTVLVNAFAVPADDDERFLASWHEARELLSRHHGYLGTRLHRAAEPSRFRYVNIARWSSPLMFSRAVRDPDFQRVAGAMGYESYPALYERLS
jgi:heme-degrading monooxygenase HmoA